MPVPTTIQKAQNLAGVSFPENRSVESDAACVQNVTHITAQPGTITASNVTMDNSGHGIQTSDRVDTFWAGGVNYGATATVTGTNVALTAGSGDTLPSGGTAVTLSVPIEGNMDVTGDDMQTILAYSQERGLIAFADSGDTELFVRELVAGETYSWFTGSGEVNPLAGDVVAKVFMSHGAESSAVIRVGTGYNNA